MTEPAIAPDALRAFAVFAEQRNFTRAAALLHISQPALHVKVGKLATTLGRQLYTRQGRELVLTPDGEAVARFARQLDERTAAFLAELRMGAAGRPLVLAAGEGTWLYLLGEAVRRLQDGAGSRLRLLTRDRDGMLAAVRSGQAQLGVGVLDAPPDGLETVPLASFPQVVVLPAGHRLARRQRLALADLDGERLVVPPPGRPHREALERALRSAGARWTVAVEAEGWPLMVHFAAIGVGLAVVNGVVRPGPGLLARPLRDLPEVTYQAVHAPGARDDERTTELLATIAATLPP
jgi:DNA-binding transcriptional LysR family regulator